ncbi:putative ribonuclease H-like domain-containing protein [Tanacetum coccineum]|uniref:Ribonuclease H-like domain-containing protein n=1 Tax=Tanacetum coccineum TaxID=301880 RepID=A0ABQ5AJY7_9ASTR
MDLDFAADENLKELSGEEAWEDINDFAQGQKEWDNPPNIISEQELANLRAKAKRLFGNEKVWVEMHRYIAWDKVDNPSPQSTPQVLLSFEVYTSLVTYPNDVEKTVGIPIEVEPFEQTQLENVDDPKKHYGFKPGFLGQSGSLSVDFSNLEVKENNFLGGLSLPVKPKELENVIKNGNKVLKRTVGETEQEYEPTTVEEKQDMRNEMEARGTLLMALPNKDQLNFHSYKDAKLLMEAIEKRVLYKVEDIATCLVKYVKFWDDWEVDRYGNANLAALLECLNEDILKITVLKTNTPYPSRKIRCIRACTHQRPQKIKDQCAVSRGLNTPYSRYGINIIFWKISNVVPTPRNPQYAGNPQQKEYKEKGVIDSGCSRHMTGNKCYLTEYEDYDGGFVSFGDGKGRISRKGKIKTGTLDFDNVYFCKELKYNLFSVSQICDKKNNVLFTDTECLVLSSDFKLLDESQVLLRVPRKDNIYSVDLKSVVPTKGLTCLFAKATIDESNLWHRRLGHINFKNMNKLVRGNLVRGLPSKIFENDHSCVAFITDDFSRFSWVFFLATKDETSGILKTFITKIENQLDYKVKVIRSDNGTEFKNSVMNQFCEMKGIKREFSIDRTPQQNVVAERRNRTLIEAARTMLVDSKLPTTFWAEAVNTACYVLNRVLVIKPHNKTPYELIRGRTLLIDFMKPFGFSVTILNTRDHLCKFDGKAVRDFLLGPKDSEEDSGMKPTEVDESGASDKDREDDQAIRSDTHVSAAGPFFTNDDPSSPVNAAEACNAFEEHLFEQFSPFKNAFTLPPVSNVTLMDDTGIFGNVYDDEDVGADADLNNLETTINVSPIPTTKINNDHPKDQIIRDFNSAIQTRRMTKISNEHDMMDVKSAFLYGTIEEEVYVCQPPGFEDLQFPDKVYKVEKALYGLHQAPRAWYETLSPRAWYETLSTYLLDNGFYRGQIDKTLFIKRHKDDILLVQIKQKSDGIFISQDKYVAEILKKFDFASVKTASTPMETNKALIKDEEAEDMDVHLYRSMIGLLMYLTASRPDIMFAVCACVRFQVTPETSHFNAVKRIFKYLKGQPKLGLWYPRDSPFDLEAFFDSDYARASLDRKSITGGCQFLGKRLISWQCKKQTIVANSTTEAEYVVVANYCGHRLAPLHRDFIEKKLIEVIKIHHRPKCADLLTKAFDAMRIAIEVSWCQDTILGDVDAQTRFETTSKQSNDPPLSKVNTFGSGEDSMQLMELMTHCTKLSVLVLDLEKAKSDQAIEIASLKKRVDKLEKRRKFRTTGLKRLKKVGTARRIESSNVVNSSLNEINDKRQDEDLMFDTGVLDDDEVFMDVTTVEKEEQSTKTGEAVTTTGVEDSVVPTIPTTVKETLAQTLMEIKAAKPKAKGIIFHDLETA